MRTDDAARRAVDAAECHFEGGDFGRVRALLEEVTAGPHSAERARALVFLGWVRANQEGFNVGADIFRAALEPPARPFEVARDPTSELRGLLRRGIAVTANGVGVEQGKRGSLAAFCASAPLHLPHRP